MLRQILKNQITIMNSMSGHNNKSEIDTAIVTSSLILSKEETRNRVLTLGKYKGTDIEELIYPHQLYYLEYMVSDGNYYVDKIKDETRTMIESWLDKNAETTSQYDENQRHIISKFGKLLDDAKLEEGDEIDIYFIGKTFKDNGYRWHEYRGTVPDIFNDLETIKETFDNVYTPDEPLYVTFEVIGNAGSTGKNFIEIMESKSKHPGMQLFLDKNNRVKSIIKDSEFIYGLAGNLRVEEALKTLNK